MYKIPYFSGFLPIPQFLVLWSYDFCKILYAGHFFLQHIAQGNCGLEGALVWIAFSKDNGSFKTLIGDEKPDPNEPVIFFCIIGKLIY